MIDWTGNPNNHVAFGLWGVGGGREGEGGGVEPTVLVEFDQKIGMFVLGGFD